jgi:hypothetical protein
MLRRFSAAFADLQNIWIVLAIVFPSLAAAVSAWSAWAAGLPWYLLLFYTIGVLCFGSVAAVQVSSWLRGNSTYGTLRIDAFNALLFKARPNDQTYSANCNALMQNRSLFDLYYRIEDGDLSISGNVHPNPVANEIVPMIIQPNVPIVINFATIQNLPNKPMTGRLKLRIAYGGSQSHLNRAFELSGEPQIGVTTDSAGNVVGVRSSINNRENADIFGTAIKGC